ncbi:BTAD domain-containing putative transcriptional regulator [Streptomyces sp. WMMC500]|uniref:BTAD domain-containing putative transcriptional regulator n=1 Tax=Streptomyces sp. WMMC500 TaxID=3015154 RepID=UPI00248BA061|nr:BTAD domain-containing putative transcriptional regulator [Streptomyces sp. WMMC500]WBB64543.1 BTAD domain-containing putative transcriptional regulator [Streptomyces sp. WMMC500]
MEFRLLGPFEAVRDGAPVSLSRRRQERLLLAVLLLSPGRTVAAGRLAELLWDGGGDGGGGRGTLHTYISRLRMALRPYGVGIITRGDGYTAELGGWRTDAAEFAERARAAAALRDPVERLHRTEEALALWRGELLDGLADGELRARLGGELAELRLCALEQRAEDRLRTGRDGHPRDLHLHPRAPGHVPADGGTLAAELRPLVARHPLRERLVAALMTALYRAGRQAEALDVYRTTRLALAAELGVAPGPALRDVHDRVLAADPALDDPPLPAYAVQVRDVRLPLHTSGQPALEFCNTFAGWDGARESGAEWLTGYRALAVWAGHLGLLEDWLVTQLLKQAQQRPAAAREALAEARELRSAMHACFVAPADRRAFRQVARAAEAAARAAEFVRDEDGLGRWRLPASTGLRLPVLAVARSAADLLADPQRFTVTACPSPDCGWLFLDAPGRRRWCSLGTCAARDSAGCLARPAS